MAADWQRRARTADAEEAVPIEEAGPVKAAGGREGLEALRLKLRIVPLYAPVRAHCNLAVAKEGEPIRAT